MLVNMEQITCLCIGDPHFQDSNMKDVNVMTKKIISYAEKSKSDFMVCLGDILHTHETISVTPFKAATQFMYDLSLISPTYLLIGNHDYKNNSQFLTDNHGFNSLKKWPNMYVIDNVVIHRFKNFRFCFCPYVPPGRFIEALNESEELWEMADCIFAHQEFYGCQMGAIKSEIGDEWDEDYPLVISGHIHDHQILNNIIYTGSIMQHGYAENGKKYLWSFIFKPSDETSNYTYKKIDLGLKQKKIVHVDMDDLSKFDPEKYKSYHLKIDIKGNSEQFKAFRQSKKYKEFTTQGIKIAFTPIHKELPQLKQKLDYKNKTFITIFRDLAKQESMGVQKLCNEITNEYLEENNEPVFLDFCDED